MNFNTLLELYQLLDYPENETWHSALRWLLVVMDDDNPSLALVASCFFHYLKNGQLSTKQAIALNRILERVLGDWNTHADAITDDWSDGPEPFDLATAKVKGRA